MQKKGKSQGRIIFNISKDFFPNSAKLLPSILALMLFRSKWFCLLLLLHISVMKRGKEKKNPSPPSEFDYFTPLGGQEGQNHLPTTNR